MGFTKLGYTKPSTELRVDRGIAEVCYVFFFWYGVLLMALYNYTGFVAPRLSLYNFWFHIYSVCFVFSVCSLQISKRYECTLNENTYFFCPSPTAIAISHFEIVAHFNSSYNTRNRWRSFCSIIQLGVVTN